MAAGRMIKNYCRYYLNRHCLLTGWIILNVVVFLTSYYHYMTRVEYFYLRNLLGHGLGISRGSAAVLIVSCALVLLPVCRTLNSTIHRTLGRYSRYFLTCWFTRLKSIHITIAVTIVISSLIHSSGHIINAINFSNYFNKNFPEINWASYKGQSPAVLILTSVVGVTGLLMLFLLVLMVMLSTSYVRQLDYDLFWGSHFLFIIFLVLFFIHPFKGILTRQINFRTHIPGCKMNLNDSHSTVKTLATVNVTKLQLNDDVSNDNQVDVNLIHFDDDNYSISNENNNTVRVCADPPVFKHMETQSWMWITGPLLMYLIDIALRIHSRNYDNTFVIKSAKTLPGDVVSLKIRSFSRHNIPSSSSSLNSNTPSQYVLLQCPRIAPLEWHPFTVVNSYRDKQGHFIINLLIRIRGDWTRSICYSSLKSKQYSHKPLRLLVDGPFFSPIQNVVNCAIVICIAGGIGITPFAAVLHHIVKEDIKKMCQPFRIHLVWVVRTTDQLIWIQDLLIKLYKKLSFQNQLHRLDFHLFITKDSSFRCNQENRFSKIYDMENVHIYHGRRPSWFDMLSYWQQYYERGTVRVFLSGPPTLIDEVESVCHKLNRNSDGCYLKCIIESFG